jgi:hypothetical protein
LFSGKTALFCHLPVFLKFQFDYVAWMSPFWLGLVCWSLGDELGQNNGPIPSLFNRGLRTHLPWKTVNS